MGGVQRRVWGEEEAVGLMRREKGRPNYMFF
jgi:hypothetical protein